MEKICIVKRRQQYAQPIRLTQLEQTDIVSPIIPTIVPPEVVVSNVSIENNIEFPDKKIVEEFVDNSCSVISITMTKEQSVLLQQSEYIKELLSGTKNDPSLDIKLNPDGKLSLNFRFNDSLLLRMLAPYQVCQMLQISRSFLQKLINEKKINSYKLGRLRRFLLEDILEYLSNDKELDQFKKEL
jgi:excisionase family DNA binding protein